MWTTWIKGNQTSSTLAVGSAGGLPAPRALPEALFMLIAGQAGLLSLCDLLVTQRFVGMGLVAEHNPVVAGLISDHSFAPIKLLGIILSLSMLWCIYKRFPRLAGAAAVLITVFYSVVLIWNISVIT
jgi:Domain of unknown function (DUF5658)